MGTILKAALTSPNEVNHLRPTLALPFEQAASMITHLVQCDNFHDIAALQNWEELLEARGDLSDKLCQMGDSIVYRLVQWTKRLPFYAEIPVEVHTRVLTHKWHELLVLTTSAWQAMHTPGPPLAMTPEEETMDNLQVLQRCLQAMMGRSLTLDQLRQDVGQMVERLTFLTRSFRRLGIRIEEYVTLKVIAMLQNTGTKSPEVGVIQERYVKYLRTFLEVTCPSHPNRLTDLLRTLPEVQAAASLLLESKMFYVPFLLNSALIQR
jgi:nuclear receptor subfamily 6 group A